MEVLAASAFVVSGASGMAFFIELTTRSNKHWVSVLGANALASFYVGVFFLLTS